MMDTDAGAWARYLKEEGEFKYGLNGAFELKGPKLEIVKPFTLSEENHLEIKFKPMFKHTLAINFDDPKDKIEDIEATRATVGLTLRTDFPVDFGFKEGANAERRSVLTRWLTWMSLRFPQRRSSVVVLEGQRWGKSAWGSWTPL